MPRVLCTLENASEEISGHKFAAVEGGMLSEDLPDEAAEHFLSIPGYEEWTAMPAPDADKPAAPASKQALAKPAGKAAAKKAAPAPATTDEKPAEQPQGDAAGQTGDEPEKQGGVQEDPDAVF